MSTTQAQPRAEPLELLSGYPDHRDLSEDDQLCFAPDVQGDARAMEERPDLAGRIYGRVVEDRGRRIYITVHDGKRVISSRTVRCGGDGGEEIIRLGRAPDEPVVCGSTFNRLRQRSDVAEAVPSPEGPA